MDTTIVRSPVERGTAGLPILPGAAVLPDLAVLAAQRATVAAELAAADADAFRAEGPRIDARVTTLLTLVLGVVAAAGAVGGVGGALSRQHRAPVAAGLLLAASVVLVTGLLMILRLIMPRLTRVSQVEGRSGALARVADLPDPAAARDYYTRAAADPAGYTATLAWRHATTIARRMRRFRRAGRVLVVGVVLAVAGVLVLGWGW